MALTLQKYIENLQELITENPDLADAEVWTATDDEGNGYQSISCSPSLRLVDREDDYSAEYIYDLNNAVEELAEEVGVYEEDFDNHEAYLKEAREEIDRAYKVVVLVN